MPRKLKKPIDGKQLQAIMRLKPTLEDTAAFFQCSPDAIERFIKRHWQLRFAEFREQNMVHTRFSMVRNAIQQAEAGNTAMMIFCLKNLCGWKDKQELTGKNDTPLVPVSVLAPPQVIVTLPSNGREAKE